MFWCAESCPLFGVSFYSEFPLTEVPLYIAFTVVHVHTVYCVWCSLQSAVGWDYQAGLAAHGSQTDAAKGFGGKYGVQKERVDKV